MNELIELSADINVITAEINAYQRIAGEAIFEIGKRLKHVKENDLAHGEYTKWLGGVGIERTQATRFVKVYEELGANVGTYQQLGLRALSEIATMPEEQRTHPHIVPSTQETKTVDEMTVRELREVKKALKASEQDAESKRMQVARLQRELERASEPVIKEIEVERIIEIDRTDPRAKQRLEAYEAKFGALENYTERHRATNADDVTTAARSFALKVRELIKQHAYILSYPETIAGLEGRTRSDFEEAVRSLSDFANDLSGDVKRMGDVFEAEFESVGN